MAQQPLRSLRLTAYGAVTLNRNSYSPGEFFFDADARTLRIFDGRINGGLQLLRADLDNISSGALNKSINLGTGTITAAGFSSPGGQILGDLKGDVYASNGSSKILESGTDGTNATFTGNVTGQVSDITNHALNELSNVNAPNPLSGQVLIWTGLAWSPASLTSTFTGGSIPNPLNIANAASSSSTSSGALIVEGGAGIGGNIYSGAAITASTNITASTGNISAPAGNVTAGGKVTAGTSFESLGNAAIKGGNELRYYKTGDTVYVAFKAPTALNSSITFRLPANDGSAGQFLQTDGFGNLGWGTATGGGGGSTISYPPGGTTGQIQFNNNGNFAASANLTWNSESSTLGVSNIVATFVTASVIGDIYASNGTAKVFEAGTDGTDAVLYGNVQSTGTSTFSHITVDNSANFTNQTNSTSTTTGSVVISGGVGVSKDMNIGGAVDVVSTVSLGVDPTQANHATTKRYVDSKAAAMAIALGG